MARFGIIENDQIVNIVVADSGLSNWVPLTDTDYVVIGSNIVGGRIMPPTLVEVTDENDPNFGLHLVVMNEANSPKPQEAAAQALVMQDFAGTPMAALPVDPMVWPEPAPAPQPTLSSGV